MATAVAVAPAIPFTPLKPPAASVSVDEQGRWLHSGAPSAFRVVTPRMSPPGQHLPGAGETGHVMASSACCLCGQKEALDVNSDAEENDFDGEDGLRDYKDRDGASWRVHEECFLFHHTINTEDDPRRFVLENPDMLHDAIADAMQQTCRYCKHVGASCKVIPENGEHFFVHLPCARKYGHDIVGLGEVMKTRAVLPRQEVDAADTPQTHRMVEDDSEDQQGPWAAINEKNMTREAGSDTPPERVNKGEDMMKDASPRTTAPLTYLAVLGPPENVAGPAAQAGASGGAGGKGGGRQDNNGGGGMGGGGQRRTDGGSGSGRGSDHGGRDDKGDKGGDRPKNAQEVEEEEEENQRTEEEEEHKVSGGTEAAKTDASHDPDAEISNYQRESRVLEATLDLQKRQIEKMCISFEEKFDPSDPDGAVRHVIDLKANLFHNIRPPLTRESICSHMMDAVKKAFVNYATKAHEKNYTHAETMEDITTTVKSLNEKTEETGLDKITNDARYAKARMRESGSWTDGVRGSSAGDTKPAPTTAASNPLLSSPPAATVASAAAAGALPSMLPDPSVLAASVVTSEYYHENAPGKGASCGNAASESARTSDGVPQAPEGRHGVLNKRGETGQQIAAEEGVGVGKEASEVEEGSGGERMKQNQRASGSRQKRQASIEQGDGGHGGPAGVRSTADSCRLVPDCSTRPVRERRPVNPKHFKVTRHFPSLDSDGQSAAETSNAGSAASSAGNRKPGRPKTTPSTDSLANGSKQRHSAPKKFPFEEGDGYLVLKEEMTVGKVIRVGQRWSSNEEFVACNRNDHPNCFHSGLRTILLEGTRVRFATSDGAGRGKRKRSSEGEDGGSRWVSL